MQPELKEVVSLAALSLIFLEEFHLMVMIRLHGIKEEPKCREALVWGHREFLVNSLEWFAS